MASNRMTMFQCETCERLFHDTSAYDRHKSDDPASGGYVAEDLFQEEMCLDLLPSAEDSCVPRSSGADSSSVTPGRRNGSKVEASHSSTASLSKVPSGPTTNVENQVIWTRPATLLLIDLYKSLQTEVNAARLRKNVMWMKISKGLQERGHKATSAQCEGRWKTLVRGLKNVSDHNNKSGSDKKSHPYEDEMMFISDKPNVNPVYVISSHDAANSSDEGNADADTSTVVRKKSKSGELMVILKEFISKQNTHLEEEARRHEERMSLFKDFINVLKESTKK